MQYIDAILLCPILENGSTSHSFCEEDICVCFFYQYCKYNNDIGLHH